MAERADCKWRHNPISDPVCHRCLGYIVQNNELHCPFWGIAKRAIGEPKPEFQHLITAHERLYSIQLKAKQEE